MQWRSTLFVPIWTCCLLQYLRRILASYAAYYNELRTHLALVKDSPCHRPVKGIGQVAARPILGGLHHQYSRM